LLPPFHGERMRKYSQVITDTTNLVISQYPEEIQERRENPDPSHTDILSLLMVAQDEDGQPMSDEELHDELLTLLVAGHETTATAIAWAFYWIHKMPLVREKLLAELDSLRPNPDTSTISKLPYLNAVCCETLRIYPVGMLIFPRLVKTPICLSGHELPVDTIVLGAIYLTHHREDIYPEPDLFRPERFLEKQFSPYEYLPFGGGARRCIGLAFAQLEMKLAIAQILSNYELELMNTKDVKPKRRGLVTGPDRPISMKIKSRRMVKSSALV
jgi:cytochrome P450